MKPMLDTVKNDEARMTKENTIALLIILFTMVIDLADAVRHLVIRI